LLEAINDPLRKLEFSQTYMNKNIRESVDRKISVTRNYYGFQIGTEQKGQSKNQGMKQSFIKALSNGNKNAIQQNSKKFNFFFWKKTEGTSPQDKKDTKIFN
jgi:hypothetical protein